MDTVVGKDRPAGQSDIPNLPYLQAVAKETLRLHPTGPLVVRRSLEQCKVSGYDVPAGATVFVNVWAIGRDPSCWPEPLEFRPERFLPGGEAEDVGPLPGTKEIRMMPFGAGHRFCPGVGLAMMNIKCFLAALVHEFEWAPPGTEGCAGVDMTELNTFIKAMKKPLSARLTRRT